MIFFVLQQNAGYYKPAAALHEWNGHGQPAEWWPTCDSCYLWYNWIPPTNTSFEIYCNWWQQWFWNKGSLYADNVFHTYKPLLATVRQCNYSWTCSAQHHWQAFDLFENTSCMMSRRASYLDKLRDSVQAMHSIIENQRACWARSVSKVRVSPTSSRTALCYDPPSTSGKETSWIDGAY